MNQKENIDELIVRYMAEEATVSEKEIVDQWISASDLNRKYYSEIRAIYEIADERPIQHKVNVSGAWEKLSKKLIEPQNKKVMIRKLITSFYGKAAILLVALTAAYFIVSKKEKEIVCMSGQAALNNTLPDGTFITLAPQTTITYFSSFNIKNRDIKLTGRAYFHVQHDNNLPFIIQVENVFVKDIGTSFTVKATPSDSVITIDVEEGEVNFYSIQNRGIALVKNETGIYNKRSATFQKINKPAADTKLYEDIIVRFENVRLRSVVDTINRMYNEQIILSSKKLESLELTATFKETTVDEIVEILAETFHLSVVKLNGKIYLYDRARKR